jgi:diadenylate cyclase
MFIEDVLAYIKNTVTNIRWTTDIIDIIIISVIIYYAVKFIRDRRAAKLLLGIFFLVVVYFISSALNMYVLGFLLKNVFQVGLIALIVLFTPELRSLLEKVGGTSISSISRIVEQKNIQEISDSINIISRTSADFSANKIGALIVIERTTKLGDIVKSSGVITNAVLSVPLLKNLFYDRAPLHDGAMIISNNIIKAAGCRLPVSSSEALPTDVGMRHRAGVGISENSDAVVVIVSEENGNISLAVDGKLERNFDMYSLTNKLTELLIKNSSAKNKKNAK